MDPSYEHRVVNVHVMCVHILILNVCIYLGTIVMHWFMRIKNLESWILYACE